ncbi:molybdopterin molybdotransferase MoeA [Dactylosporangium sp. NPDC000555]|uniref:molybdopterin molybdotransferase MoeA n=1 Tax=Dactylosporangium sp. NPDC000555 TaxID=3154260 RepID=UPI0033191BF0
MSATATPVITPPPHRSAAGPAGVSWARAYATAREVAVVLPPVRRPVADAVGQVLAEPVVAAVAAPAFAAAAMDGYAVAGSGPWRIVGRVLAGGPAFASRLGGGDAVEIATGTRMPDGADAVLPYERCDRRDTTVNGTRPAKTHIRCAGEDARPGDLLVPAGRQVTPAVAALAAQVGVDEVEVRPRPAVDVIVTGDEVVLSGTPGPGQVRDAFAPLLAAVIARAGGRLAGYHHVADDPGALRKTFGSAADVVVVTGSSSAGAADHLRTVLAGLAATWHVDGVECRPGHPQGLAVLAGGRPVVSLPGNPYAGLVAALTLLEPVVATLAGHPHRPLPVLPVTGPAAVYPGGARIVPVQTDGDGDGARIVPGARSGSLRAAATADALAVLDPAWTTGAPAPLLRLP